jgi:hypothetical protein
MPGSGEGLSYSYPPTPPAYAPAASGSQMHLSQEEKSSLLSTPPLDIVKSIALRDNKPRDGTCSQEFLPGDKSVAKHMDGHEFGRRNCQEGRIDDAEENETKNTQINMVQCVHKSVAFESILNPSVLSCLQGDAGVEVRFDACGQDSDMGIESSIVPAGGCERQHVQRREERPTQCSYHD